MTYAAWQMTQRYSPTARTYKLLKHQLSESLKNMNYEERYGVRRANEIKKKIGQKSKGRQPMLGKKHSPQAKRKMSKAKLGIPSPKSEETKRKMSETWKAIAPDRAGEKNGMFGKTQAYNTKKLISEANKGEKNGMFGKYKNSPTISCPHCGKTGKKGPNFIRWHFDNCKGNK